MGCVELYQFLICLQLVTPATRPLNARCASVTSYERRPDRHNRETNPPTQQAKHSCRKHIPPVATGTAHSPCDNCHHTLPTQNGAHALRAGTGRSTGCGTRTRRHGSGRGVDCHYSQTQSLWSQSLSVWNGDRRVTRLRGGDCVRRVRTNSSSGVCRASLPTVMNCHQCRSTRS